MISGRDIICISSSDWNRPWGSRQQLMLRLSSANRILYVEYQASFLHFLSLRYLFLRIKKWKNGISKINSNLFVITPYPSLPFGCYFRKINKVNQAIISRQLRKAADEIGMKDFILWIYPPTATDLLRQLRAKFVIYHCIADFSNEKKNRLRKINLSEMEKELAARADIVLALTESLYRSYKGINNDTYLFPSAVDDQLFSPSLCRCHKEPDDITGLKKPRIGVIGYLDSNILDVELLSYVGRAHPEWSVILIGPRFRHTHKFRPLGKINNIYFLGEKENTQIPLYIKALDVCAIPYRINSFTNNISSLKLYEYFAFGKPVVSTRLADLEKFKDLIKISDSKEAFARDISLALSEKDEGLANKEMDIANKNSWDARLGIVSQLINNRV